MRTEKVVIVGASGYSGEELVRLLSRHPQAEIVALTSRPLAGRTLASVYPRFTGTRYSSLKFIESTPEAILATGAAVVFLALPHGVAAEYAVPLVRAGVRVLDLSADFRLRDVTVYEDFYGEKHPAPELSVDAVYGLPELYRDRIRSARLIACPGCYPTSVLVPLVPLLRQGLLAPESIVVFSMSGVSGAGRTVKGDYMFAECNESVRAYGVPKHRHLAEIEQELTLAAGVPVTINFTPHLVPVNRGIHTTIYATPTAKATAAMIAEAFTEEYEDEPFVRLLDEPQMPDTKFVTGTNFIDVAWRMDPRTGRVILLSAEDNLVKGAAGQAVQCLNIVEGWPEQMGLME